jgi:hypothetical protein
MIVLLLFFVAFGAGTAVAAERQDAVPGRFVGEWVADLKRRGSRRLAPAARRRPHPLPRKRRPD